ncbi:MAG: DUF503 domain-containing protein [Candidatus Omnitrophica bacterium]|nr:DUF503 domain-containing protein [Candidatus Omnitrophota bacterium]MCB9721510.1 DUF503 domain-containing protein [Candidatus Omnitrophota bacterium]
MFENTTTHLQLLTVRLHIPHAQSLKEKRMVIKSLKERMRHKFNVTVAEIGQQDKWQVATLGIAMVGNDNRRIHASLQNVITFMERFGLCEICETDIEEL